MSIPTTTHACAACLAPARAGVLMCLKCWRLLPEEQRREVNDTWAAFEKREGGGDGKSLLATYREVRTRAINTVRALRRS